MWEVEKYQSSWHRLPVTSDPQSIQRILSFKTGIKSSWWVTSLALMVEKSSFNLSSAKVLTSALSEKPWLSPKRRNRSRGFAAASAGSTGPVAESNDGTYGTASVDKSLIISTHVGHNRRKWSKSYRWEAVEFCFVQWLFLERKLIN